MLLQNDAKNELSKEIYKNIIKLGLHRAAIKTPVLPYPDVIESITRKIDHQHRSILNVEGKVVANYKPSMITQMYHLKEATVKVSLEVLSEGRYIRIAGSTKPPHWLPHFVPDSLLIQEIAYQTFINGVAASPHKHKKGLWPQFPSMTPVCKIENFR